MAATAAIISNWKIPSGGKRVTVSTVTFDSSYPAGGESISANTLGLTRIEAILCGNAIYDADEVTAATASVATGGATCTIRLHSMGAAATQGTELLETNVADQSATTITVLAIGV